MIRKQSKQRDMILNYMKGIHGHVSAEEVFDDLNQGDSKISLATVYRNLNILVQMNEIKKIAHPIFGYVYDKTCQPHYHLHCIKCDQLYDFPYPYMLELDSKMESETGLSILSHNTMFEGICEDCKNTNKHS